MLRPAAFGAPRIPILWSRMNTYIDQRRFSRRLCKKSASIRTADAQIKCVILDENEWGAGLVLIDDAALPNAFELVLRSGEAVPVEVVWRSPPRCGVVFRRNGS